MKVQAIAGCPPDGRAGGRQAEPGACRRRVAEALRLAREAHGLTRDRAAQQVEWSVSKLVRIETATTGLSVTDLRALLDLYQVSDPDETDRLEELARAGRRPPWFSRHRHVVTPDQAGYLDAERSAASIGGFRVGTVPGLLQTADYAFALLRARGADQIAERVDLLLARQELLSAPDCPDLHYVLDESAVRRPAGGPAVMAAQMTRLRQLAAAHPQVIVSVLPFTVGGALVAAGSFTVIDPADRGDSAAYYGAADGRIACDRRRVGSYRERLDRMHVLAVPADRVPP